MQVFSKVVSLEEMMKAKIAAFLERKEIRDAFDIEFLLKKGINLDASYQVQKKIANQVDSLTSAHP